jgi:hypothetical protein
MFPYYAAFMEPERREAAAAPRTAETTTASFSPSGSKLLHNHNELRFCPECNVKIMARYGEVYWRREHQIPTVLVCPDHSCPLQLANISSAGTRGYCAATLTTCPPDAPLVVEDLLETEHESLLEIAKRSFDLLKGDYSILSKFTRPEDYQTAPVAKGLGWGVTFTDPVKLRTELITHFGHLGRIWPWIFAKTGMRGSGAIDRIAGAGGGVSEPLLHILIAMTLDRVADKRPAFGNGPWPCPNPLAVHGSELPITRIERSRATEDLAIGRFYCPCGYVYVRSKKLSGELGPPEVRIFGETLRPLLRRAIAEKWALARTARAAGIGVGALKSQAKALGFNWPWEVQWINSTRKSHHRRLNIRTREDLTWFRRDPTKSE